MSSSFQRFSFLLSVLLLIGTGCQTFNMSDEKFAREQNGRYDKNDTGTAVECLGWPMQFIGPLLSGR